MLAFADREGQAAPSSRSWSAHLPLFWRFQLGGWAAHAVVSMPLKVWAFGSVRSALLISLIAEPIGLLLTWGLRHAYQRLQLRVERPRRLVAWVLACALTAATIDWALAMSFQRSLSLNSTPLIVFGQTWLRGVQYVGWTVLYFWIKGTIAARERAVNLLRAEAAANEAELRMLRAQIDPHFLFNALNTVLAGVGREPQALTRVVQGLADYLRYSLAHRHTALVPLGDEFDAALSYLVVEKARFRDDLIVDAHVDDAARAVPVPGVLLQPLIENAVKHGYRSSPVPLRLRVDVRAAADGGVVVEVTNSGRWIDPPVEREAGDSSGVGLESVRRRLALLYPGAHQFNLFTGGDQVTVRMQLPPRSSLVPVA